MTHVPINPTNDQLANLLKMASEDDVVLTRDGKPVGVIVALNDDDDLFDYQLESDPRFAQRIAQARREKEAGRTRKWDELQ